MLIRTASSMFKAARCTTVARRALIVAAAVAGLLVAQPYRSVGAEKTEAHAYNGAAVTVVRAKRSCFAETISVSGMLAAREEVSVRPEREGLQISQVLVDAGETVTSGQVLARLVPAATQPNSSQAVQVQAPVAGIILKVDATIGTTASPRAAPLFQI